MIEQKSMAMGLIQQKTLPTGVMQEVIMPLKVIQQKFMLMWVFQEKIMPMGVIQDKSMPMGVIQGESTPLEAIQGKSMPVRVMRAIFMVTAVQLEPMQKLELKLGKTGRARRGGKEKSAGHCFNPLLGDFCDLSKNVHKGLRKTGHPDWAILDLMCRWVRGKEGGGGRQWGNHTCACRALELPTQRLAEHWSCSIA